MNAHMHFSNEGPLKGRFWYTAQFSVISYGEISAYETNRKRICAFLLEKHTNINIYTLLIINLQKYIVVSL
jgi:hypothetical protein